MALGPQRAVVHHQFFRPGATLALAAQLKRRAAAILMILKDTFSRGANDAQ
jgi:hypothetical protein